MELLKDANRILIFLLLLALTVGAGWRVACAAEGEKELSLEETLKLGERMYRDGVLPSGEPMKAFVNGDVPVEGTAFTCVSCHLRSGLGSIEGGVVTPPTNGRILYQARDQKNTDAEHVPLLHKYSTLLPPRPAYTDASLEELIQAGVDPTGRSVTRVMPIYELNNRDMKILVTYLKSLSENPPPGVSEKEINFATVIVEGSDPLAIESMLAPIQHSIDRKNSLAKASGANKRVARMGYNMLGDLHSISFTFDRWILRGAPDTWRAQLDGYYKTRPVFALLGGISPTTWEPIHRFCEENGVPNLFPIVEEPVLSSTDWYTFYLSRGPRQEGEAAARYLHGMYDLFNGRSILQVAGKSDRAKSIAAGFREGWATTGHAPAKEVTAGGDFTLSASSLDKLLTESKPAALLIWEDASLLPLLEVIAGHKDKPGLVIVSADLIGKDAWKIDESLRSLVHLTYPYRLPQDDRRFDNSVKRVIPGKKLTDFDQRVLKMSYITSVIFGDALMEMRGEYHRDFLLESIAMMKDMYYPLFERVSFGPGQRYISKGAYIVQLTKGDNPTLEKKSEWVTH